MFSSFCLAFNFHTCMQNTGTGQGNFGGLSLP